MRPYTLTHNKMLASTMQHSTHNHTPTPQPPPHPHHTPHRYPTHRYPRMRQRCVRRPGQTRPEKTPTPTNKATRCLLRTQQRAEPRSAKILRSTQPHPQQPPGAWNHTKKHPPPTNPNPEPATSRHLTTRQELLRKEVIQPHLPVRLPCYDFVPIASPTFDNSPPRTG
jgi:hypothetical protein